MKLNNRGWGNKELIISCCIIFILLLIVVINVNRLYGSLEESLKSDTTNITENNNTNNNTITNNNTNSYTDDYTYDTSNNDTTTNNSNYDLSEMDLEYYKNSEARLKEATRKYIIENNIQLNEVGERLEITTLINSNYISDLHDLNDNSVCGAYSYMVMNEDYSITIKPYISCSSYKTEGF